MEYLLGVIFVVCLVVVFFSKRGKKLQEQEAELPICQQHVLSGVSFTIELPLDNTLPGGHACSNLLGSRLTELLLAGGANILDDNADFCITASALGCPKYSTSWFVTSRSGAYVLAQSQVFYGCRSDSAFADKLASNIVGQIAQYIYDQNLIASSEPPSDHEPPAKIISIRGFIPRGPKL